MKLNHDKFDVIMAEFSDVRFDARVLKQAQALAHSGHNVALHMYNSSLGTGRVRKDGKITYFEHAFGSRMSNSSSFGGLRKYVRAIAILLTINLWVLTHRAAVYHAHNLLFLLCSVVSSRIHRAKLVYDAHEIHCEHYERTSFKGRFKNGLNEKLERICLRSCDVFIQASDERAEYIADRYKIGKPAVINNYVPLRIDEKRSNRIQRELGLEGSLPIMFYSGGIYLSGNRRLDRVFQALAEVQGVNLVVVGFMNDSIREQLLDYIAELGLSERVFILPPCPSTELFEYASSADFGVIPLAGKSLNNKMSALNKISEYLMAGLPLICSDYENLKRIVYDNPVGQIGEVFDVSSVDSIKRAIELLVQNHRYKKMRENSLMLGQKHMNWEQEELTLLQLYSDLEKNII